MAKNLLTATKIKRAVAKGERRKLFDGGGLILRIQSATAASWVFKFTDPDTGKPDEMALGSYFKLSVVGADIDLNPIRLRRDECALVVERGGNPKAEQRAEKHERRRAAEAPKPLAIGELIKANIALIAQDAKSERQRQAWINSLQFNRIGAIAKLMPHEVTDLDAITMMQAYYKASPVMADDVRQRLSRLMIWASPTAVVHNPFRWEGHLEKHCIRKCAETEESHPSLPHDQIGEFVAKLRGENERVTNALALEWLILTAARADEACEADWSEIDWETECWVIPAHRMKMRREHAVPLTERHFEILAKCKPPTHMGPEYPAAGPIFLMPSGDGPSVSGLRKFMQSQRDRHGKAYVDPTKDNRGITLHGFRSSFRTWGEDQMLPDGSDYRYSEKLLETCIAHAVGSKTRRKYVRSQQVLVRREIMTAWVNYCGVVRAERAAPQRLRKAA